MIHQEDVTNVCAPNKRTAKYVKQKLLEKEKQTNIQLLLEISTLLCQKWIELDTTLANKEFNTINQQDLMDTN